MAKKVTGCGVEAPDVNEYDSLPAVGEFPLPPTLDANDTNLGVLVIDQIHRHGIAIVSFRDIERAIVDNGFRITTDLFTRQVPDDKRGARFSAGDNGGYRVRIIRANPEDQDKNRTFNVGPSGTYVPHAEEIDEHMSGLHLVRHVIMDKLNRVVDALPTSQRLPLDGGTIMSVNCYDQPGADQQGVHCDGTVLTGLIINRYGLQVRRDAGYYRVAPDTGRLIIMSGGLLPHIIGPPTVHRVVVDDPSGKSGRISFVCFANPDPSDPLTAAIHPDLPAQVRQAVADFDLSNADWYRFPMKSDPKNWHARTVPIWRPSNTRL